MPKVNGPLFSRKARGQFAKSIIFTRAGDVRTYFKPRNPNTEAQQAVREAFKEFSMPGLTQEQADLLYAAILHDHDELYSLLGHNHDDRYKTSYLFPFSNYYGVMPINAVDSFPFGGTSDGAIVFEKWTQGFSNATTHDSGNHWEFSLWWRQAGSSDLLIASISTSGISGVGGRFVSTTDFEVESVTGEGYLYIALHKVGSPGDMLAVHPAIRVH